VTHNYTITVFLEYNVKAEIYGIQVVAGQMKHLALLMGVRKSIQGYLSSVCVLVPGRYRLQVLINIGYCLMQYLGRAKK
jgi:hypothetical protein